MKSPEGSRGWENSWTIYPGKSQEEPKDNY